jgi:hypothetical protein
MSRESMKRLTMGDPKAVALSLLAYCQSHDWAGYDPYDALNSRLLVALPFLRFRPPQLVLTQALKRSPINLRRVMLIPQTQNPKALALFLGAFLKLAKLGALSDADLVRQMIDRLIDLRSDTVPYWCWGYSFPWQTRGAIVARGAPNLVCTSFVATSLLDAYEERHESRCLDIAIGAAEYIVDRLYWTDGRSAGFAYPTPSTRIQIHNANFLGAAFLCRAYAHTGETRFLESALAAARYSAARQHSDGSWSYGDSPTEQWIDNFHTGYNLCALQSVARSAETTEFDSCVQHGFQFYRSHFFRQDGAPRYFHNRTYPIDIHAVAQSIITLLALSPLDRTSAPVAHAVFEWAMRHMWDPRGFFYYRVLRFGTIRTSYMRWSQAWMLLAISTLLAESRVLSASETRPSCAAA